MTAPTGIMWSVEILRAVAFVLDSSGLPQPTSTTVFEGLELQGVQSLDANWAKPRAIANVAQGRVRDVIYLPPNQVSTATLKLSYADAVTQAALMGVKTKTLNQRIMYPHMTNRQGHEPNVMLFVNALVTHNDTGDVAWRTFCIPRCRMVLTQLGNFDANASIYQYDIAIGISKKDFNGVALTVADNGCTEEGAEDSVEPNCMNFVTWKANGTELDFLVPTAKPIADFTTPEGTLIDMTSGTVLTPDTVDATGFHFTSTAPASGHILGGNYGYAG